jgi:hypothetical protein
MSLTSGKAGSLKTMNYFSFAICHFKGDGWGTVLKTKTDLKPNEPSSLTPNGKWKITLPELSNFMSRLGRAGGLP